MKYEEVIEDLEGLVGDSLNNYVYIGSRDPELVAKLKEVSYDDLIIDVRDSDYNYICTRNTPVEESELKVSDEEKTLMQEMINSTEFEKMFYRVLSFQMNKKYSNTIDLFKEFKEGNLWLCPTKAHVNI